MFASGAAALVAGVRSPRRQARRRSPKRRSSGHFEPDFGRGAPPWRAKTTGGNRELAWGSDGARHGKGADLRGGGHRRARSGQESAPRARLTSAKGLGESKHAHRGSKQAGGATECARRRGPAAARNGARGRGRCRGTPAVLIPWLDSGWYCGDAQGSGRSGDRRG